MASIIDSLTPLQARSLLRELRAVAKHGLNADSGDEEREALAEIGSLLGLTSEWDDERDMEVYK